MKNKKSQIIGDVFAAFHYIALTAAIIIVISALIALFVISKVDTKEAEAAILTNRILFSKSGIIYFDEELNRAYPGIIDLEKFNDSTLNDSINLPENKIVAAKLTLYSLILNPSAEESKEEAKSSEPSKEIKTIYFNKNWYENWIPRSRLSGPGGTTKIVKEVYVLIKKGEQKAKSSFEGGIGTCTDPIDFTAAKVESCDGIEKIEESLEENAQRKEAYKGSCSGPDCIEETTFINKFMHDEIDFLIKDPFLSIINLQNKPINMEISAGTAFKSAENPIFSLVMGKNINVFVGPCETIKIIDFFEKTDFSEITTSAGFSSCELGLTTTCIPKDQLEDDYIYFIDKHCAGRCPQDKYADDYYKIYQDKLLGETGSDNILYPNELDWSIVNGIDKWNKIKIDKTKKTIEVAVSKCTHHGLICFGWWDSNKNNLDFSCQFIGCREFDRLIIFLTDSEEECVTSIQDLLQVTEEKPKPGILKFEIIIPNT